MRTGMLIAVSFLGIFLIVLSAIFKLLHLKFTMLIFTAGGILAVAGGALLLLKSLTRKTKP